MFTYGSGYISGRDIQNFNQISHVYPPKSRRDFRKAKTPISLAQKLQHNRKTAKTKLVCFGE
jgi:hypothetical protein